MIKLTGVDLERFFRAMNMEKPDEVHTLRFLVSSDTLKVKANEWIWSPPLKVENMPQY